VTRSNGAIRTRTLCESISDSTITPSADQFSGYSKRDERVVVLPEKSASSTDLPKGWANLFLFIQCAFFLLSADRMVIVICAGSIVHILLEGWIKKRFWPPCENRAIEEAHSEKQTADVTT
jgi:hypothetical protein